MIMMMMMTMRNAGAEMSEERRDAFGEYVTYYEAAWPLGDAKLCGDTPVADKARRLLSESAAEKRFTTFDFYSVLRECLKQCDQDPRRALCGLAKAAELLETYCVNAFLFPWKKEIRTLKTFTGPFVYYVQAVLPDHVANNILESIGYHQESDTEYRLSKDADPGKAMRVGFEVFLARQECEYLLEVMGQRSQSEFVEVLKGRSSALLNQGNMATCTGDRPGGVNLSLEADVSDPSSDQARSLVDPGTSLLDGRPLVPERPGPNIVEPSPTTHFSDDQSILEMQANYPDLTIRQQPIFSKSQMLLADQHRHFAETRPPEGAGQAFLDPDSMSGPPSMTAMAELRRPADGAPQPPAKHDEAAPKPPADTAAKDADANVSEMQPAAFSFQQARSGERPRDCEDCMMSDLAEKMGNLKMKDRCADENLKYPIEETSHPEEMGKMLPLGSAIIRTQAILCNPSLLSICNIPNCSSCTNSQDSIKEPPQSFYIPPSSSPLGSQTPTLDCRAESSGELNSCPQCLQASGAARSRSEDELLQTYVLVENDRKDDRPSSAFSKSQG
ncbi:uncharacterized protein [Paramormyrops kingsleyae]|uniref:Si:ch211-189a15.5 n=1 Tax=Paramormyrops kingsleyae TaxID=1676925 RepID=A0A3B3RYB2_9TELE|nr:spermatogenesis-associated protein 2-like protein [Paramormyrops kingsleyae]